MVCACHHLKKCNDLKVDVEFVRILDRFIPLKELQKYKEKELKDMPLMNRGRLSVQSVDKKSWDFIMELEKQVTDS